MRSPRGVWGSAWGAALLASTLVCGSARAELDRADPLLVPSGPLPVPEDSAGLPLGDRLQAAETVLRGRGFREMPVLAWAALEAAKDGTRPNFIEKALRLAPRTPGVLFEAARQSGGAGAYGRAVLALLASFPGMIWLLSTLGVALGLGVLVATAIVVSIGYGRTLALHGHELGHFTDSIDPPSWPGMLLGISALAMLPLFGMGPLVILAVAGMLAALRLPRRASLAVAASMVALCLCAGPLLDAWSKISAVQGQGDTLLAVWRVERGLPLPGDEAKLSLAAERAPDDLLPRLGLATMFVRRGDLEATERILANVPTSAPAALRSQAFNVLGSVQLARGEVKKAVEWLEDARAAEESATVLYNLSQAYGRALRLEEHSALFIAARERDAELIHEHTQIGGTTFHSYLIQPRIPLSSFLAAALAPSTQAADLARNVRIWTLGRRAPAWSWVLLPVFGLAGVVARRQGITRCKRCAKVICTACSPDAAADICVTCERLRSNAGASDPRLRRAQLDLDRARRRRLRLGLFGAGMVLPGLPAVFDGQVISGYLRIAAVGTAVALLTLVPRLPGPWEVGNLGVALPNVFGFGLLIPLYALGLWAAFLRLRTRKLGA